jgi:hypothetical protein
MDVASKEMPRLRIPESGWRVSRQAVQVASRRLAIEMPLESMERQRSGAFQPLLSTPDGSKD